MPRLLTCAVAVVAGSILLGPSSAQAATVVVGPPLTGTTSVVPVGTVISAANTVLVDPGARVASPADGTVISWQVSHFAGGPFYLQVIRLSGGSGTSTGTSAPQMLSSASGPSPVFPASLSIKAGDLIGWKNSTFSDNSGVLSAEPGASSAAWVPPLVDGAPPRAPSGGGSNGEYAIQATVRYCAVPALKNKKIGAAEQVLAAADCTLGNVSRPKGKAARKKAKFVKSQSVAPGTSISDTAPIDLTLGKGPKKHKK